MVSLLTLLAHLRLGSTEWALNDEITGFVARSLLGEGPIAHFLLLLEF